jgi:hypothetical protein
MLVALPACRIWGADYLGLNRAVLVLVPFAIAWMAIAMLDAPVATAQPAAPGETAADEATDAAEATPSPAPAPEPV